MAFFIIAFFVMSIIYPLIFKKCAVQLDHRTAPIFISVYTLFGLLVLLPWFLPILKEGSAELLTAWPAIGAVILKSIVFFIASYDLQKLRKQSLSTTYFILPFALLIAAIVNYFFGEMLSMIQWFSVLGLSTMSIGFYFFGHAKTLNITGKALYFKMIILTAIMIAIDHYAISHSNWYTFLFLSNGLLLVICALRFREYDLWKTALSHKTAVYAGLAFVVYEVVKFYPMVTIVPVRVIAMIEAASIPIVLIISALVWDEGTWKEQALWGFASLGFIIIALL